MNNLLNIVGTQRNGFGNDYHTELLIHSDTIDKDPVFIDSSRNVHSFPVNDFFHSTMYYKFGTSSLCLTNPLLVTKVCYTDSSVDFYRDSFCFDCWVKMDGSPTINGVTFLFNLGHPSSSPLKIWIDSNDIIHYYIYDTGRASGYELIYNATNLHDGWHHVAATRYYYYLKLFYDGVLVDNDRTTANSIDLGVTNGYIGMYMNNLETRTFYLDEYRVSKGDARHNSGSGFTLPNRRY